MSIDYDQLRELAEYSAPGPWRTYDDPDTDGQIVYDAEGFEVAEHLSGYNAELAALAPDMARELLRLRDGVEVIRDRCAALAKSAQNAGIHTLAREMDTNAKALTGLLNGDTE